MTDMIVDMTGMYLATKLSERLQAAEEHLDRAISLQRDHEEILGPVETEQLVELMFDVRALKERIDASISEALETSE
jgi:hypothetical protein